MSRASNARVHAAVATAAAAPSQARAPSSRTCSKLARQIRACWRMCPRGAAAATPHARAVAAAPGVGSQCVPRGQRHLAHMPLHTHCQRGDHLQTAVKGCCQWPAVTKHLRTGLKGWLRVLRCQVLHPQHRARVSPTHRDSNNGYQYSPKPAFPEESQLAARRARLCPCAHWGRRQVGAAHTARRGRHWPARAHAQLYMAAPKHQLALNCILNATLSSLPPIHAPKAWCH